MGLATSDSHSHKVQTKLYKILKFGVNRPYSKQDTAIWICHNLQRNVWTSVRMPPFKEFLQEPMLFLAFLNRSILVKTGLINTKLKDFVNLGVLFLTTQ